MFNSFRASVYATLHICPSLNVSISRRQYSVLNAIIYISLTDDTTFIHGKLHISALSSSSLIVCRLSATELFRSPLLLSGTSRCNVPASFWSHLVLSTRHASIGDRAFAVAGPRAWNSLPPALRLTSKTFSSFKKELISFTFGLSFWSWHVNIDNVQRSRVVRTV